MQYYDRIDISKWFDTTKSNKIGECMICHYWFFNHAFAFQDCVCNACHGLTMYCLNVSNITMITVESFDYCCIIHNVSKSEGVNLSKNYVLEVCRFLWKNIVLSFSLFKTYIKWFSLYKLVDSMCIHKPIILILEK